MLNKNILLGMFVLSLILGNVAFEEIISDVEVEPDMRTLLGIGLFALFLLGWSVLICILDRKFIRKT